VPCDANPCHEGVATDEPRGLRLPIDGPCVSVIIPTLLRPSLSRAIRSVASSAPHVLEVIVVVDRSRETCTDEDLARAEGASLVLFTGGGARGGGARNLGVRNAEGDWVAFLDDDDEWLPGKLAVQLAASSGENRVVVASRLRQRGHGQRVVGPLPDRTIGPSEPVQDYLFRGRKPSIGRSGIWTSTLLVPTCLAQEIEWDAQLPRHQDWDWVIRLQREGRARLVQVRHSLADVWVGSEGSISASTDWESSLAWVLARGGEWDRRTVADFIAAQPFRYAAQSRSLRGMSACLKALCGTRVVPSIGPTVIALAGALPRHLMASAMLRARSARPDLRLPPASGRSSE
jgi:hypothetical protein